MGETASESPALANRWRNCISASQEYSVTLCLSLDVAFPAFFGGFLGRGSRFLFLFVVRIQNDNSRATAAASGSAKRRENYGL